ncbi:hypothetical protein Patl1_33833 [Pistacia atlantica]|uniref:Uncharacterized protein n=1 Tax=Pistacia atlantica TaxID=434234 RepID=A0ACC0ZV93_9ROSI|nr:hypothetical protein Patl1_33833 [Pistacia atlantica]
MTTTGGNSSVLMIWGLDELEQFVKSLGTTKKIVDPLTDHSVVNDVAPLNFFFDDGNFFDNMDIGGLI